MQRLFAMFPGGAPGLGLLLLRCALAADLLQGCMARLAASDWTAAVPLVLALALLLGLLTPLASVLCVVVLVSRAMRADTQAVQGLIAISVPAALALLGPGAFSVDARLFGRRMLVLRPPPD